KLLDPRNEYGAEVEDEFAAAAARERPGLPVPERSILVAPQTDAALSQLIVLAEPLARSEPTRELIIARLVRPSRGAGAGVRRRARLGGAGARFVAGGEHRRAAQADRCSRADR